jgi:pullulanase/glycogen debranching enzyme
LGYTQREFTRPPLAATEIHEPSRTNSAAGESVAPGDDTGHPVNFAVFSRHAQAVSLVLFKEGQEEPLIEIPLDPTCNRTGDVWHVFVHGLPADILYGYRVQGPWAP